MDIYEVCTDTDYPQYAKSIEAFDIQEAVERAAKIICHENAEYGDFDCYARLAGDTEWREFNVTVESEPVFYASEAE